MANRLDGPWEMKTKRTVGLKKKSEKENRPREYRFWKQNNLLFGLPFPFKIDSAF